MEGVTNNNLRKPERYSSGINSLLKKQFGRGKVHSKKLEWGLDVAITKTVGFIGKQASKVFAYQAQSRDLPPHAEFPTIISHQQSPAGFNFYHDEFHLLYITFLS